MITENIESELFHAEIKNFWKIGKTKHKVFPDPVRADPITSKFFKAGGIHIFWIFVIFLNPRFSSFFCIKGKRFRSRKLEIFIFET